MPGRKPKPTLLKNLHGNPEHRRPNLHEPKPTGDLVEPPPYFNASQRALWDYTIRNSPPGMLKAVDRAVVVSLVVHESLFAEAVMRQNELGLLTRYGPPPSPKPGAKPDDPPPVDTRPVAHSPYLSILNNQSKHMRAAAGDLGLTPVARTRIAAVASGLPSIPQTATETEGDVPLDDYLAGAPAPPGVH